jgi:hypothetical protein
MAITVYYSMLEDEWIRASEPVNLMQRFHELHDSGTKSKFGQPLRCPAVSDSMINMYGLSSIYDYELYVDDDFKVSSPVHDQKFYDSHVIIRDISKKYFSFLQRYIFFTDAKSLELSIHPYPFMEQHDLSKSVYSVPGKVDIGKWFRPLDYSFYIKDDFNSFKINQGDIYSYISFNTKEKIIFKKFAPAPSILMYSNACVNSTTGVEYKRKPLEYFYNMFSFKKQVLKEIKKNLV